MVAAGTGDRDDWVGSQSTNRKLRACSEQTDDLKNVSKIEKEEEEEMISGLLVLPIRMCFSQFDAF